ncbi:MAG: DNA repair protein RadC [Syntrophobacterales bacterium]|nr:DNA repair protein RadC [Syntrophobacterales bacterium]
MTLPEGKTPDIFTVPDEENVAASSFVSAETPSGKKHSEDKKEAPHYHGHRRRLRERFILDDAHLADYEILELLLGYAIPRKDVKPIAKALLKKFSTLNGVMDASLDELVRIPEIGMTSAVLLKVVRKMGTLYLGEKAREKEQISCTEELINYCRSLFGGVKDERFCVIYLTPQNRIIDMEIIAEGIVNQAIVYPRKVLEQALQKKASAIILVHNHPSGYLEPSPADIQLTHSIIKSASVLNIAVHDHLIIGGNDAFSFREEGFING